MQSPRASTISIVTLLLATGAVRALGAGGGIESAALSPRSGPRGATMFREMDPAQTGIVADNNFSDPKMWEEREKEFALGATGTGIAIGDYDGDGRPDIFVVSKTERSRLFRNLGGWKFQDVTDAAGLAGSAGGWFASAKSLVGLGSSTEDSAEWWKQGATFADVNNDGRLDLYVCRFGARNLLYINQGDGTFKEEAEARGLALSDASGMAEFCDYDRDGWLDAYVHTTMLDVVAHPGGQQDHLYHNNGDGSFAEVTRHAGIAGDTIAHSATWWDYDGDAWPDLYVANDFAPLDRLYRNNRDGTFTDIILSAVPHVPYSSMGADLGDVNNDGRVDLLIADMAATSHEKDQRGIASARELTANENENADLAQYPHNALFLNTGTGRFLEGAYLAGLAASDWTWSVRLEDLDNDGRLDAHFTNGMVREYQNTDLRDRVVRADTPAESRRIMKSSPAFPERNLAFRNLGDLQFEDVSAAWGLDQRSVSFGAAFGDLDGDGDLDLVFANYQSGPKVLRNDSDSGHRAVIALRGVRSNRWGVGATVTIESASGVQVRPLVLSRGYMSASEPVLHFGLGNDARINRMTVDWPGGAKQVFENLDVDRKFTVTEPESAEDTAAVGVSISAAGTGARSREVPHFREVSASNRLSLMARENRLAESDTLAPERLDRRGPALAVGDLDGDGIDDVVLGGTAVDPVTVVLANKIVSLPRGNAETGPIAILDADGDGANDLLVTGGDGSRTILWLNDGGGRFHAATPDALPGIAASIGAATVADFDRDGRLDVFLGSRVATGKYPVADRSWLLANRSGRFEDVTASIAPQLREAGLVTSALWSDVDGDGWIDLLVATEWGTVRCFHNERGTRFEDWSANLHFSDAGSGWWTSLATADFNDDGRPDYVAGNVGLNTPYQADSGHPTLLYLGDFSGRGSTEIVEAMYEGGNIFPRRTAKVLGARIPALLRRFPRNDIFARATIDKVLGEDVLAKARRFAATELRSGVFLSQPDGTYKFMPLPRIAQIAPLQGIVAGDFNGDGSTDIYAVQNSNAPAAVVGHFDGGLSQLLLGDGRGGFTAVGPADDGLVVPGDAKALAAFDVDRDGWADFVLSRNNARAIVWRNEPVAGRHSICIRLSQRGANPSAVGARVTVILADGSARSSEIAAGAGYYSQSAAAAFHGWADGNPPKVVRVRWPDGSESETPVDAGGASVVISR